MATEEDNIDNYINFIYDNYLRTTNGEVDGGSSFIQKVRDVKKSEPIPPRNSSLLISNVSNVYNFNLEYDITDQYFHNKEGVTTNILTSEYIDLVTLQQNIQHMKDEYDMNGKTFAYPEIGIVQSNAFSSINNLAEKIYGVTVNENSQKEYYYRSFGVFLNAALYLVKSVKTDLNRKIFKKHVSETIRILENTPFQLTLSDSMIDAGALQKLSNNYQSTDTNTNIIQSYLQGDQLSNDQKTKLEQINTDVIYPLGQNIKEYINYMLNESNHMQNTYNASSAYHSEFDNSRKKLKGINEDIMKNNNKSKNMVQMSEQIDSNASYYNFMFYLVVIIVLVILIIMGTSLNNSYATKMSVLYSCITGLVVFYIIYAIAMRFLVVDMYEGFSDSDSNYVEKTIKTYMYDTRIMLHNEGSNSFYISTLIPSMKREEKKYDYLKIASVSHYNKQNMYVNDKLHTINKNRAMIDLIVGMVISIIAVYMVYLTFPESTFLVVSMGVVLFSVFFSIYVYTTQKRASTSYKHMYFSA